MSMKTPMRLPRRVAAHERRAEGTDGSSTYLRPGCC